MTQDEFGTIQYIEGMLFSLEFDDELDISPFQIVFNDGSKFTYSLKKVFDKWYFTTND